MEGEDLLLYFYIVSCRRLFSNPSEGERTQLGNFKYPD
ncbi:hypothetical protein V2J09_004106 [Rumex salicifolius]